MRVHIDIDYGAKNLQRSDEWDELIHSHSGPNVAILLLDNVWRDTRAALIAELSEEQRAKIGVGVIVPPEKAKELLQP